MGQPGLEALRVLRCGARARTRGQAHNHGHGDLAAEHIAHLRRLVHELVHTDREEVAEHELGYGPQARCRRADRAAYDGALGDGRVPHPLRAEFVKHTRRDTKAAAEGADVLTEQDHVRVLAHPDAHALPDGLAVSHHRHLSRTSSTMSE